MPDVRPPVLRSKLRPPAPGPGWVERSALVDRLATSTEPIWVVTAPAGFGKTTLIARVTDRERLRTAWVSLDSADTNPVRFWSHVIAALADLGVDASRAIGRLLDDDLDLAVDEVIAALEADAGPLVLVLDDAHELAGERVVEGVERLVGRVPAGVRLAFTSRTELDLGLVRRRSHGAVLDVSPDDLAFSNDEGLGALADDITAGVVTEAEAIELIERIEGWPAGVQLARLALRSGGSSGVDAVRAVTGSTPQVMQYLAAEVLSAVDPEVRRFLIDTSILVDLDPAACDAVSGRSDSLAVLRRLAADQVFVSLIDATSSTFRAHRMFRDFLLAQLGEEADDHRRELHRRAMRWHLDHGGLEPSIWHAVQAEEYDTALATLRERMIGASNQGQIDEIWTWIGWIGADRLLSVPDLAPLPAWISLNQGRYGEIEPWLEAIVLVDDLSESDRRGFALHAATIRAGRDRHLGRLDTGVEFSAAAMAMQVDGDEQLSRPTVFATHAQLLALTGADQAASVARQAIDMANERGETPPLVMAYSALGLAAADSEAALAAADSALSLVTDESLERFHRPAMAWCVRARATFEQGRVADARAAADRAIAIAEAGDEPAVFVLAEVVRARSMHLIGDDEGCRAALRRADAALDRMTGVDWIAEQVRAAHAATRFAPGAELDRLPVGARDLSDRELAVLQLLPFGLSRRELASQLFVSENTVKTHLTSIRRKLGVAGRDDVVERARSLGLLPDEAAGDSTR